MSARVGIIIPNYNHAKFLRERINSVLKQTYQDFDLYILDDNSQDNSKEIIEEFRNNSHVKRIIYNDHNSGSSFIQWDKGIQISTNEMIWIAESDDICDEYILEELVREFDHDPKCVLAFSKSVFVDLNGQIIGDNTQEATIRSTGIDFIKTRLYRSNTVKNASSALFKRSTALNVGKEYTKFKGAGDWLFWIEIAKQGNIAWVRKPMNYFRQHENTTKRLYTDGTTFFELHKLFNVFEARGYINSIIKKHIVKSDMIFLVKATTFISKEIAQKVDNLYKFSIIDYIVYYFRVIRLLFIS